MDINYTLVILPHEEPYYYLASVVAQFNVCKLTLTLRDLGWNSISQDCLPSLLVLTPA